jgi:hypothetical protein
MFGFTSRPFGARTPAENAQLGEAFENAIFSLYGHGVFPGQEPHVSTDPNGTPVWLQNVLNGANFNRSQAPVYPYNELYVQDPSGGYPNRLDSYNPFAGEIVSRKLTQFSAIQPQTGINYVNEVAAKYAPGTVIADVPTSGNLAGKRLSGQMILEVPPQNAPIPQAVLDAADAQKILIRDIKGHVY